MAQAQKKPSVMSADDQQIFEFLLQQQGGREQVLRKMNMDTIREMVKDPSITLKSLTDQAKENEGLKSALGSLTLGEFADLIRPRYTAPASRSTAKKTSGGGRSPNITAQQKSDGVKAIKEFLAGKKEGVSAKEIAEAIQAKHSLLTEGKRLGQLLAELKKTGELGTTGAKAGTKYHLP